MEHVGLTPQALQLGHGGSQPASAGEVNVEQAQVYAPLEVVLGGQGE